MIHILVYICWTEVHIGARLKVHGDAHIAVRQWTEAL